MANACSWAVSSFPSPHVNASLEAVAPVSTNLSNILPLHQAEQRF